MPLFPAVVAVARERLGTLAAAALCATFHRTQDVWSRFTIAALHSRAKGHHVLRVIAALAAAAGLDVLSSVSEA